MSQKVKKHAFFDLVFLLLGIIYGNNHKQAKMCMQNVYSINLT